MAQRTRIELVDDIDGTGIAEGSGETVGFSVDGVTYEIDLTDANAAKLRASLAPFVSAGRRVGGTRTRATAGRNAKKATRDYDIKAVRAWAGANKVEVPARGRIPAAVVEQFKAAGN